MKNAPDLNAIPADQAWRIFADWKANGKEIGVFYHSRCGSFTTMGTLRTARNGTVEFGSGDAKAAFRLNDAQFTYGAMQTWPHWPYPPIVEVMALQASTPDGSWLAMAEGVMPDALSATLLAG